MPNPYCNIYQFADFRVFLKKYQIARQKIQKSFSKTLICNALGLPNTRSYFQDVINGRMVTPNFVDRFIDVLQLDREEAMYFRTMVSFNQSASVGERELLFNQLIGLNKTPKNVLQKDKLSFYNQWYNGVIRNMLEILDISDNYALLAKRIYPKVSINKIKNSMDLLRKLKLIKKNAQGHWKTVDKSLSVTPLIKDECVKQYQAKKFQQGIDAHLQTLNQPKRMSTITCGISDDMRARIETKIEKFQSEIRSMVHKDAQKPESVFQLNIQFFPHTTKA